ncbi:MAG: hypothetical protein H8D34_23780 [Chloroflexi bacterium]|nr:hypothetical protein [Chloroflexota bacterium]
MRKRIISIATLALLVILCFLILIGMPAGGIISSPSGVLTQNHNPSTVLRTRPPGESLSNEYVCSHYLSLLADELDRSETPFRTGEYESFRPGPPAPLRHPLQAQDATLKRHFVSSGIYLPMEMETTNGTAVTYTIVAYWLTPEGELKEDLVALGVELPDGGERFFLDDPAVDSLQAARASLKPGAVFTATMTGLVSQSGVDWGGCPSSDFAGRYGEQACLVGAALAKDNPPEVSSGFMGSFLFGWQLKKTGEMIPFPICQYIEES